MAVPSPEEQPTTLEPSKANQGHEATPEAPTITAEPGNAGAATKWTEASVIAEFEKNGTPIKHTLIVPRIVALLTLLDEMGVRESAPDNTETEVLPILQKQYIELKFTPSTLEEAWKAASVLGLLVSKNRKRCRRTGGT